ncbi:MAG TPA: bile acid:sodium symporter [Thermoanaerobaculia bacterium]|nr:bile acid:sodium symporter [Thermoanaerobaculia bacterium]HQR65854.1 bile acid:sodium symporter [Thermoanaerobaculia bacterium]
MKPVLDVAIPFVAILAMTIVGLDLTRADFARVRARPRVLAAGLFGPLVLLPPAALAVLALVPMPEEIRAGLLLLAVCPVGGISNTYNYLARAATALSVTLTALSCLLAVVTMPLLTRLFEALLGRPFGFRAPVGLLMAQVLAMLVLPVAGGMALRARAPAFVARHEKALRRAAFASLALLLGFVLVNEWDRFVTDLGATALASAIFVALAMGAGALSARAAGADRSERFTLSVEFATRNCAIAAAIAITFLGDTRFAVFATTYFFTESVLILAAAAAFRRAAPSRAVPSSG